MPTQNKKPTDLCSLCPARHLSAFKDLNSSHCDLIDSVRTLTALKVEDLISFTQKNSRGFYCIRSGHVKLGSDDVQKSGIVRICGPGDLVGYETATTSRSAQSLENAEVCFINQTEFLKIQNSVPEISSAVIHALVKIIKIKDERIIGLENHSVKNRVASTLYSLVKKFGSQKKQGLLIDTKIDRKTLAKLAGTVIESLARILTDLENEKIISRQGRNIFVLNQEKLREVSLK